MSITAALLASLSDFTKPPSLNHDQLPNANSSDLALVPATGLEYAQTALLNGEEWKGPLTIEQYLDREVDLQATDLTKNGRITGWILTSTNLAPNPDGSRPILASCETLPILARVVRQGISHQVQGHGIASVYTRPEHRGKGYAGRMMADLGKRLETWQQIDGQTNLFSVLFSDIGDKFYARYGWKVFESTHIHLDPVPAQQYDNASALLPAVKDLSASDLSSLHAVTYIEQHLVQLSKADPSRPYLAIDPDVQHFSWHHSREEYQARVLGIDAPKIKGAIHPQSGIAIVWNRRYTSQTKECQLHVLHTTIPPDQRQNEDTVKILAALFLRAQREAADSNMIAGVEIWDPSEVVVAAAQVLKNDIHERVQVITRDKDHLCSLRWSGGDSEDPVWISKEKYAWC